MNAFKVHWNRPHRLKHVTASGFDYASTFAEACDLAKVRVRHCGLNARADVYVADDDNTILRQYGVDFDGRLYHIEGEGYANGVAKVAA